MPRAASQGCGCKPRGRGSEQGFWPLFLVFPVAVSWHLTPHLEREALQALGVASFFPIWVNFLSDALALVSRAAVLTSLITCFSHNKTTKPSVLDLLKDPASLCSGCTWKSGPCCLAVK